MTGGGSSELKSLRSQVERALEICGNVGADLGCLELRVEGLEGTLGRLPALPVADGLDLAALRTEMGQAIKDIDELKDDVSRLIDGVTALQAEVRGAKAKAKPKRAPRSKAQPRAKAR
jgi:hypothetical protein